MVNSQPGTRMLELMDVMRTQRGIWPSQWRINRTYRPTFAAMLRAGWIEECLHLSATTYRLTEAGKTKLAERMVT